MTDDVALLQAVRDDPDDDLPRLAYADWLEEHGQRPRAAFIRAQVERARLPWDDDRQSELQAAERRLLIEHGQEWLPAGMLMESVRFARGFVEQIGGTASQLRERFLLWRDWPVRRLALDCSSPDDVDWLRDQRWLARIRALCFSDVGPAAEVALSSPHLTDLRRLTLCNATHFSPFLRSVERTHVNDRLESLGCVRRMFDDPESGDELTHLLSLSWPRLRYLDLGKSALNAAPMGRLMDSELWPNLDEVKLGYCGALADAPAVLRRGLARMGARRLSLIANSTSLQVLEEFARAPSWGRLSDLEVCSLESDRRSLDRFLAHGGVGQLRRLCLDTFTEDYAPMANCASLSGLRWLELAHGPAVELAAVARSPHLVNLVGLRGDGVHEDCRAFVRSPAASRLRWWEVGNLNDSLAGMIAESHLPRLATLRAAATRAISDDAAHALIDAPGLPWLSWVTLGGRRGASTRGVIEANRLVVLEDWHTTLNSGGEVASQWRKRYRDVYWPHCLDDK